MLERLRDRAKIAFAQCQSGLGPQQSVDESEFPDDVAIISGRASVINRSGSSQSPNSTSRLSESPQSMPMGITTSPTTSPVVSDARIYNLHGSVDMSMGDVMQDLGLDYYNPNHNPSHPHQHSQYMSGMNGTGGVNGMSGTGVNGMVSMNGMNGMNGAVNHGSGGMLPPPAPHLGLDQMYGDPHSQQQYIMVRISCSSCWEPDVNPLFVTGPASHISPTGLRTHSGRGLAVAWAWWSRRDLDELHAPADDSGWAPPTKRVPAPDGTSRLKSFNPPFFCSETEPRLWAPSTIIDFSASFSV